MLKGPALKNNPFVPSKGDVYTSAVHRSTTGDPAREEESDDAKVTEAIDEAYQIGDTLIFLREYPV